MHKISILFFIVLLSAIQVKAQSSFTKGNLVVYKIGNGTDTLSSAGFLVNVDEFTPSGTFVQSHPLPTVIAGNNKRMVAPGNATTEGQITLSTDKKFLLVTGYDTFPDPKRLSLSTSTASNVNRVVGIFGADGVIDATTALPHTYSGSNFRGAASTNGSDIWLAGTSSSSSSAGVRYTSRGSDSSKRLSSTVTNIRAVNIFNGQLYCTTGSGAFKGISTVGIGLPVDSPQVITILPGFPNTSASTADPYAFSINSSGNVAYIADGRSKANGGGVQKWSFDGTNWSLVYTLDSVLTTGLRNLVVDWSGNNAVIYAVSADAIVKNLPGNKIVKVTDTDSAAAFTVLAIAEANTVFRGIAFAPESTSVTTTYTFTGNGSWKVANNWANNSVPPLQLPAASSIVIDHSVGGQCLLDVSQHILSGASLIVKAGKNLVVPGLLTIQ